MHHDSKVRLAVYGALTILAAEVAHDAVTIEPPRPPFGQPHPYQTGESERFPFDTSGVLTVATTTSTSAVTPAMLDEILTYPGGRPA